MFQKSFNQPNSTFGGSSFQNQQASFGTPTFGTTSASFPQTSTGAFGVSTQSNNIFGNSNSTTTAFGGFQQQQAQPTTSVFGQQANSFGATQPFKSSFNFSTQPQQSATQQNLFSSTGTTNRGFGSFAQPTTNTFGTTGFSSSGNDQNLGSSIAKYQPTNSTDTLVKNGQQNSISTRQHCITAMKEYENKSLEEIRFEDYSANRKGAVMGGSSSIFSSPQQQQTTNTQMNLFGSTQPQQTSNIFGSTQTENKNPFGQSTFGQQSSFLNSSTTDFGTKPFGTANNTFALPNTDNNNSIFGSKPAFGAPTSNTSVFGVQTSSTPSLFGTTNNAFATPAQPLSAAPASSAFGTLTNSSGFGSFGTNINTNQTTSLFGTKPNTTSLTSFNATPAFGVSTQGAFPTFNANTTTSTSLFNTQVTKPNTTFSGFVGLNTALNNPPANQSFFSANVAKPSIALGSTLGKPSGNSLFSNLGQPPLTSVKPTPLGVPQSLAPQLSSTKNLIHQQLLSKVSSPFGDNPLFKNIKLDQNEDKTTHKLIPPKNPTDSLYKVNTKSDSKLTFVRNVLSKKSLFEGLEEYDKTIDQCFNFKSNNRRLLLTPKESENTNLDECARKSSELVEGVEEQEEENESININRRPPAKNKQDSWLCPDKFKETGKVKDASFENTMNELVPNKEGEKESVIEAGALDENVNECKIILTRPGYFTIPSINELKSYVKNDKCVIPNFTIGRTGYGNIYFNEDIDVFGLNLDTLVFFRHKEVTVYPDEDNKPPVGQGLNREAQVTLDQVWPNDKTTQNYIKDINQLSYLNFEGKLRRICEKKGIRFIEYRPETGSWVFKVKHFSKYGYNDSDEEDEVEQKEVASNKQLPAKIPVTKETVKLTELTARDFPSIEKDENENAMFFESVTSTIGKINKTNTRKLQLMKATYFVDEPLSDNEDMVDITSKSSKLLEVTNKSSINNSSSVQLNNERSVTYVPEVSCNLRFDYSLSTLLNKRCLSDMALLNRNRFKSVFGRNNLLLVKSLEKCPSYHSSNPKNHPVSSLNIVSVRPKSEIPHSIVLEFLKINFNNSERFDQEFSDCPVYKKRDNDSMVQDYIKAINANKNSKLELFSFLKSIWDLCSVLWGDIQNEKQWCNNEQMIRRNLFTKWLEDNCDNESLVNYTDELLNLALKHKISEACHLAMKNNDLTMALLLAQSSNRKNFKDIVEDQLSLWNTSGVDKYIHKNRLLLIMMIAGVPIMDTTNFGTISLFENKDWLQVLSIQHWYLNLPTCSIERSVYSLENLISSTAISKKCLIPTFYDSSITCEDVYDVRYHILNLYSNSSYPLEKVINNVCNTSHVMDYFTSWMLLDLLKLLGYKHCSLISERKVVENMAMQLEYAGFWEWSIYVLLHIDSKTERETSIQNVLIRNIEINKKESFVKQKFVVDGLGIPRHWIDIAKYYKSRKISNPWLEFKFLLRAQKNSMAIQTFHTHMAPHAIINGNFSKITVLLEYLDTLFSNRNEGFSYWEITGQAILNFVNLLRTSREIILEDHRQFEASVINIKREFEIIISKIKRMPTNSIYDVLCQTEICQNLHLLLNNVYSGSAQKNQIYDDMLIILEGLIPYDLLKI